MKEDDIVLLTNEICDKNKVVLKEFPFLQNGTIITETNEVLIPQYVAALYKTETTYQHSSISTLTIKQNEKKSTADWIYFKIYCHPLSSNTILTEHLLPFINKLKRHKLIKKWFWIRYNDPDYHIRIRVQTSAASEKETFNLFTACLNKLQINRFITRFYPSAYLRELDRYSAALIEYVEDVFQASSECIALLLKEDGYRNFQSEKVIIEAVLAMHTIFDLFELSSSEKA